LKPRNNGVKNESNSHRRFRVLGQSLNRSFLSKGYEIVVIDNKTSNVIDEDYFSGNSRYSCIVDSILNVDFNQFKDIDVIYHLASVVGPSGILKYAGKMGKMIVDDMVKIRDYCIKNDTLFVDISTSEIYGHTGLLKENSEKIFPGEYKVRTEYGAGKMLSEIMLTNTGKVNDDLRYHIIRPFNITGERQLPDGGFVLPRFVVAALTDQPITVFGDGLAERAFTSAKDICNAVVMIAESEYFNEIWNIGNLDNHMTILELANMVSRIVRERYPEKKCEIIHIDPKIIHGDLFSEAIDKLPYIEKFKQYFDYELKYSHDDIIREVVDHYDSRINSGYTYNVLGRSAK
jgi:UDP-glucose 4-epimerase